MSSEAKRVKLLTLIALGLGLVIIGFGIYLAVSGAASAVWAIILADGVGTLIAGGRGALIANVPARISKLATLGLILLLVQVACIAALIAVVGVDHMGDRPLPLIACGVDAVLWLCIFFLSRGIAKRSER